MKSFIAASEALVAARECSRVLITLTRSGSTSEDSSHFRDAAGRAIRGTRCAIASADADDARHRRGEARGLHVPADAVHVSPTRDARRRGRTSDVARDEPDATALEYGVRVSDSAFKRASAALQPGDTVVVQGPLGHYILDTSRPAILVAGGIGITPLKGMAEYAADRTLPIPST
jgi:hypothetical protein